MTISFSFHWWIVPLVIAIVGFFTGSIVMNRPESGMFSMNTLVGFCIIAAAFLFSIAIVVGHFI